jgi:hypothetical protein
MRSVANETKIEDKPTILENGTIYEVYEHTQIHEIGALNQ